MMLRRQDLRFVVVDGLAKKISTSELQPIKGPRGYVVLYKYRGQYRAKNVPASSVRQAMEKAGRRGLIGIPIGSDGEYGIVFQAAQVQPEKNGLENNGAG